MIYVSIVNKLQKKQIFLIYLLTNTYNCTIVLSIRDAESIKEIYMTVFFYDGRKKVFEVVASSINNAIDMADKNCNWTRYHISRAGKKTVEHTASGFVI